MGTIISIMNAKGGVGKSTTTMMLAETLAATFDKRVLIIDADPQASVSLMMLGEERVKTRQAQNLTLAELIEGLFVRQVQLEPSEFIQQGASDLIGASDRVDILIGNVELAWTERHQDARNDPGGFGFIKQVVGSYDFVLIDCSPSITTFTEKWLRTANYNIVPMRPDYLSQTGFNLLRRLRQEACREQTDFASHLGTILTMRRHTEADAKWIGALQSERSLRCFNTIIKFGAQIQAASEFSDFPRTYRQKYGEFVAPAKAFVEEILQRIVETAT